MRGSARSCCGRVDGDTCRQVSPYGGRIRYGSGPAFGAEGGDAVVGEDVGHAGGILRAGDYSAGAVARGPRGRLQRRSAAQSS